MKRHIRSFLISFLLLFIILLTIITIVFGYYSHLSIVDILFLDYTTMPFIVILLSFTFFVTLIGHSVIKFIQYRRDKKVERALTHLIDGDYTSKTIRKMAFSDKVEVTSKIDNLFVQLQRKLISISHEIVLTKEEQAELSTETREEILEDERKRIARELHDSVSQHLFASSMILSAINEQDQLADDYSGIASQLQNVEKIINDSQLEMRALLLHLRPVQLKDKRLKEGIEQLLQELSSKINMQIKHSIEDISLPASTEDNLFRVVQELLSNVLRHSKASELEVYLKRRDRRVTLRVVDDGVGFDMDNENSGSYGLPNIKERISGMGGNVKIVSIKNQGTSVDITIPVDLEEYSD